MFRKNYSSILNIFVQKVPEIHCLKSVSIWSFSDPNFPALGLNTDHLSVFSTNAGKYGPETI